MHRVAQVTSLRILSHQAAADSKLDDDNSSSSMLLHAPGLSAVYSMQFDTSGRLLAAGGKGGIVAIFTTDGLLGQDTGAHNSESCLASSSEHTDPLLLSFKGHKGWISSVAFITAADPCNNVSSNSSSSSRLVTSSNDGVLKLWDLSKQSSGGMPLL